MKQGWEIKKLGKCFEYIKNGANIKQERGAGGIPITRIETLSGGIFNRDRLGYADIETIDKYQSYVMQSGDLLLSHINSKSYIGRVVVYVKEGDETIIHGMNLLRLKVIPNLISPFYMYYYTQTHKFKSQIANRRKDAVNQSSISVADLKTIDVPVPPREEQERIVAELDCLSGVIEKKREQLKQLDALAQSIFYQMFGAPITNEKGWDVKKLGEVCKFSQGVQVDLPLQSTEKKSGWNRFLRIVDYTTCNTDIRYVNISNDKYFVNFDDVVVVRYGASAGFVGIEKEGILANNLFKLNHDRNKLNYKYLYYLLSTDYYKDFVKDIAFGAAMPALSFNSFKNFNIYIPPIALQQEYAEKIEAIERQKELIKQSIYKTEELFNSRMDYYFN